MLNKSFSNSSRELSVDKNNNSSLKSSTFDIFYSNKTPNIIIKDKRNETEYIYENFENFNKNIKQNDGNNLNTYWEHRKI